MLEVQPLIVAFGSFEALFPLATGKYLPPCETHGGRDVSIAQRLSSFFREAAFQWEPWIGAFWQLRRFRLAMGEKIARLRRCAWVVRAVQIGTTLVPARMEIKDNQKSS